MNEGPIVVGSNVSRFDLEMLRRSSMSLPGSLSEAATLGLSDLRIIDVVEHDLAIEPSRVLRPRRGLTFLSRHYGVKPGGHDALEDARAAVEVFMEQVLVNNAGQTSLLLPTDVEEFSAALGEMTTCADAGAVLGQEVLPECNRRQPG